MTPCQNVGTPPKSTICVGNLKLSPPVALAPMVGLSHSALRSLVSQLGGVGLLFTEMLSVTRIPQENPKYSPLLIRDKNEQPLFYQIYATETCSIEPAIARLEELGADGIDVNLGCPAPQMKRMGAGQFLIARQGAPQALLKRIKKNTALPVSVKVRIGVSAEKCRLKDFCRSLEDCGIDLITIHARLNDEKFCRKPRWSLLSETVDALFIPVFANGGIFSVEDARACMEQSGASGVMIGRGAAMKPWLLRDIATEIFQTPLGANDWEKEYVYFKFIELLSKRFAPERRLGRLKKFTHYFASNYTFGHRFAAAVQNSKSIEEVLGNANDFFRLNSETGGRKDD